MPSLPITLLAAATLAPLAVALAATLAPAPNGPVAAVFPPWWKAGQAIAQAWAAGPVIREGAAPFIIVVAAADRARLRSLGAWLLLDPGAVGGCLPQPL